MPKSKIKHTYRLVLSEDGRGTARTIEFEGIGAECALYLAQRHCAGREAELLEDDRSLGRIKCHGSDGYWLLSPSAPRTEEETCMASPERMRSAARQVGTTENPV